MRRFHFRLEKLLELRRYEERDWELKLARASGACLLIENRIREIDGITHQGITMEKVEGAFLDVRSVLAGQLYLNRMFQEKGKLSQELSRKEKEREEIKQGYLEVSRRRKVLEKLKEKKEQAYYYEQRQAEFKVLDEINDGAASREKIKG